MNKILTALVSATFLAVAGTATAAAQGTPGPDRPGADRQDGAFNSGKPNNAKAPQPQAGQHDRYWKPQYKGGYAPHDRVFGELRRHHYDRFDGQPYFFNGRYVVKARRGGKNVFVEVNPYTGAFLGEVRF
jgi:hypothetical protein